MKRTAFFLFLFVASAAFLAAQDAPVDAPVGPVNRFWSLGFSSNTKFFFASYPDGGSNIFTLDAALIFCVGPQWRIGGGLGFGGGASSRQTLLPADEGGESRSLIRNPWVVPAYLRLRCLFQPGRPGSWYANLDAGYMLGLVRDDLDKTVNYYSAFLSPSVGRQFGLPHSESKVSLAIGAGLYWERRQQTAAPYAAAYAPRLGFLATFAFDIAKRKRPKVTVSSTTKQP